MVKDWIGLPIIAILFATANVPTCFAQDPQTGPTPVDGGTDNTINMTTSTPILPDKVLDQRAARADFALGDKSPGQPALKDAFKNSAEPIVRQTAAAQADVDFKAQKLAQIQKMTSQGAPLGAQEIDTLMAMGQTPLANPDTVIEDKFADKMVSYGVAGDPANNTVFQKAFNDAVDSVQAGIQKSKGVVSRHQTYKGVLEEASAAYNDLPWVDTSGNFEQTDKLTSLAKGIFSMGLSTYVNQRNLLDSSPTNSIIPGNNKLEQIQYLYLLPPNEGRKKLVGGAGPGSDLWKENPSDAMDFIQSVVQFSTSDAYVDNVFAMGKVAASFWLIVLFRNLIFRNRKVGIEAVGSRAEERSLVDRNVRSVSEVQTDKSGMSQKLRDRLKRGLLGCAIVLMFCTALSFAQLDYAEIDALFLLKTATLVVAIIISMTFCGLSVAQSSLGGLFKRVFGVRKMNADPNQQALAQMLIEVVEGEKNPGDVSIFLAKKGWPRAEAGDRLVHALSMIKIFRPDLYPSARFVSKEIFISL
jgi:hypothetical protein